MPKIGDYLKEKNVLNSRQINSVLKEVHRTGVRKLFGRIAIDKGYTSEEVITRTLLDMMRDDTFGLTRKFKA